MEETLVGFREHPRRLLHVGLPRRRLRWHYRSRREPLIAFSNRHFYDNELVTFPERARHRAIPPPSGSSTCPMGGGSRDPAAASMLWKP